MRTIKRQRIDRLVPKTEGSGATIRREMRFPKTSPERVWQALTDAEQLAKWLLPVSGNGDIIPTPGHQFVFVAPEDGSPIRCEVIEADPGHRLAYTWRAAPDQPATLVTWTLERDANSGGSRLFLQHDAGVSLTALLLAGMTNGIGARLRAYLRADDFSFSPRRRTAQRRDGFRTGVLLCR